MKLTKKQKIFYESFDSQLQARLNNLVSAEDRAWGKTTILNEIGFTYQALGYNVLLLTNCSNSIEYFATRYITIASSLRGFNRNKTIVIIDECNINDGEFKEILKTLDELKIPYVGFVRCD